MAAGALAGAIAITQSGASVALALNLASYVLALMLFRAIPPAAVSEDADTAPRRSSARGFRAGWRYMRTRGALLVVVGGFAIATLATGLTNATLPRLLDDVGLGAGAYGFGLAVLALGLLLGEAAIGVAADRVEARWLAFALAGMAALFALLGLATNAPAALIALGLAGFVNGTAEVILVTAVQQDADPEFRGRVFALASTGMRTTMLGAVAAAPLVNAVASPHTAVLAAAAVLAAGAALVFAGTREPHAVPTPAAA